MHTATLRQLMFDVCGYIAIDIQYRANNASTEAALQQKRATCQTFIAVLNEIIGDVEAAISAAPQ